MSRYGLVLVAGMAVAVGCAKDGGTGVAADYTLSLTPAALTIAQGATGSATVTITRTDFIGAVTLSLGNAPAGVTGSFNPAAPTGTSATLTVSVGAAVAAGVYNLTVDGTATAGNRSTPLNLTVSAAVGLTLAAVTTGAFHSCGVTTSGVAYCWGANFSGQLGDGTTTRRLSPALVSGGPIFAEVDAGGVNTCGLTTNGVAYCWGNNGYGQVGDGTMDTNRTTPVPVLGGHTFAAVSGGEDHTCALTTSGVAYCWGSNFTGMLGDGTTTDRTTPVLVSGGLTFAAVSAGAFHTCGVTTSGVAYCWGSNSSGQLGDGTTTFSRTTPVLVLGGLTFAAVSAGEFHSCGVTTSGAAYCWGSNFHGRLGDGTTTSRLSPVPVSGGLTFAALSAGNHSCGVTTSGVAYCWGNNDRGQLGDGSTTNRTSPALVSGGLSFAAVSVGGESPTALMRHSCGVTTNDAAYCWGGNFDGQLGDGTQINRLVPVRVGP
jgi:alpha-tubulin suppressor-like RCC1 family protein